MGEISKKQFISLLQNSIIDGSVKEALTILEAENGYIIEMITLDTERARSIYQMRVNTSNLPSAEIRALKDIVVKLDQMSDPKINIITIMKERWMEIKDRAFIFFVSVDFDQLLGVIRTETPGGN